MWPAETDPPVVRPTGTHPDLVETGLVSPAGADPGLVWPLRTDPGLVWPMELALSVTGPRQTIRREAAPCPVGPPRPRWVRTDRRLPEVGTDSAAPRPPCWRTKDVGSTGSVVKDWAAAAVYFYSL